MGIKTNDKTMYPRIPHTNIDDADPLVLMFSRVFGFPQWGHTCAFSDIICPHFSHFTSAISDGIEAFSVYVFFLELFLRHECHPDKLI